MSYILEALRRADSERDRSAVPGLAAQAFAPVDFDDKPPRRMPLWGWLGLGMLLAVLVMFYLKPASSSVEAMSISAAPTSPPFVAPQQTPANAATLAEQPVAEAVRLPSLPPPQLIAKPTVAAKPPPAPEKTKPAMAPPTVAPAGNNVNAAAHEKTLGRSQVFSSPSGGLTRSGSLGGTAEASARSAVKTVEASAEAAADVNQQVPQSPQPPLAATATTAAESLVRYQDLPPSVREQLPPLSISGSVYTPQAKNRVLILNGQVIHEGESPAAGLKVQHIKLKSAVMEFKGQVFEMAY